MDFDTDIEIRETMSAWGPWTFEFENGLPSGITVSNVVAKVYEGKLSNSDDLATATEITGMVDSTSISSDTLVGVMLSHPGTTYSGNATLVFTITASNSGVYPFFAYRLRIQ